MINPNSSQSRSAVECQTKRAERFSSGRQVSKAAEMKTTTPNGLCRSQQTFEAHKMAKQQSQTISNGAGNCQTVSRIPKEYRGQPDKTAKSKGERMWNDAANGLPKRRKAKQQALRVSNKPKTITNLFLRLLKH